MSNKGCQIGVDLGTQNTLVYVKGRGIIFNEPTVVALDKDSNKMIAIGHTANEMVGKAHEKIKIVKPLDGGVIADLNAAKLILETVFNKIKDSNIDIKQSTLLICCPSEMTTTERDALKRLANQLSIKDVFVEQEIKAGAIGAGIDIFSPKGSMLIDIGGGTTDIGVLSLGDVVVTDSIRVAGKYLDNEIIKFVKYKYNMFIGEKTAEKIKIELGTLRSELTDEKTYTFAGRNTLSNLPEKRIIKQSEVRDIFIRAFELISNKVLSVLQLTPPELAADILEKGITVNGGGALIDGIQEYFGNKTGLNILISNNPLTSIAEGSKYLLQNRGSYLTKPTE